MSRCGVGATVPAPHPITEKGAGVKQAIESFFISDGDGGEVFVPKGKVLPDNHPHATGAPLQFEELALDEVPEPPPAKRTGLGRSKAS